MRTKQMSTRRRKRRMRTRISSPTGSIVLDREPRSELICFEEAASTACVFPPSVAPS
jgi:hypothetical protein